MAAKYYKDMTSQQQLEWIGNYAKHKEQIVLIEDYIIGGRKAPWTKEMAHTLNEVSELMGVFQPLRSFAEQVAFDGRTMAFANTFVNNLKLIRKELTNGLTMQGADGRQYLYIPELVRTRRRGRPSEAELAAEEQQQRNRDAEVRKTKALADMLGMKVITDEPQREKNNEELAAERAVREADERAKNPSLFEQGGGSTGNQQKQQTKQNGEDDKQEDGKDASDKQGTNADAAAVTASKAASAAAEAAEDASDAATDASDSASDAAESADAADNAATAADDAASAADDAAAAAKKAAEEAKKHAEFANAALADANRISSNVSPVDPSMTLSIRQLRPYLSPELAAETERIRDLRGAAAAAAERAKQMAADGRQKEDIAIAAKVSQEYLQQYQHIFEMVDEEMATLYARLKDDVAYYTTGDGKKYNRDNTMEVAHPYWTKASDELRARIKSMIDDNNPEVVAERNRQAAIKDESDRIIKYLRRTDKPNTAKRLQGMTEKLQRLHELIGTEADAYQPLVDKCREDVENADESGASEK